MGDFNLWDTLEALLCISQRTLREVVESHSEIKEKYFTEKEQKILTTFDRVIPRLPDSAKSYLLGFSEGLEKALPMKEEAKQPEEKND